MNRMAMPGFGSPRGAGVTLSSPDDGNAANTAMLMAGGELLALWEAGSPARMDPETLATRGFKTFRDDLAHMPFLAHPRVSPTASSGTSAAAAARIASYGNSTPTAA